MRATLSAGLNIFLILAACTSSSKAIVVTTITGGGLSGSYADGTGTAAKLNYPYGIAADGSGNLYVADTSNDAIREIVTSTLAVTTAAGTIGNSDSSDDTIGTDAKFNNPNGVAVGSGALYVSTGSHCIRKMDLTLFHVSTLAGSSPTTAGCTGGYADGTGTAAAFQNPTGMVADTGAANLYVADSGNSAIRKIAISSAVVTTFAGSLSGSTGYQDGIGTAAVFWYPSDVTIDASGTNLYVSDRQNAVIRQILVSTKAVTTLVGNQASGGGYQDGVGTNAQFTNPRGIVLDGTGAFLYVADSGNYCIRKVTLSSATVTTLVGTNQAGATTYGFADGSGFAPRFRSPCGLATDGGTNLYVVDNGNQAVRQVSLISSPATPSSSVAPSPSPSPHCIAAGAPVLLANGSAVPIETLSAGTVVASTKGPVSVTALHGHRLNAVVAKQHVLHFAAGSLGLGLPDGPLSVTDEHGFANPATDSWILFNTVKSFASSWPAGTVDADGGLMVYQVALDTDDPRPILVAGLQVASWTRDYPDRADMPVVA